MESSFWAHGTEGDFLPIDMKAAIATTAAAVIAGVAVAAPSPPAEKQYFFDTIQPSFDLVWHPCNETYQCAILSVPLNPLNPDNGYRSEIPIIKRPANPADEYKGIVLTNPGGPGGLGIEYIFVSGEGIANVTGPGWDVIGFDPRGMGYSRPNGAAGLEGLSVDPKRVNATYIPPAELKNFKRGLEARAVREDHYGIEIPFRPNSSIQAIYESGKQLNTLLAGVSADNQAWPYMTTPNVAFDMLEIAKADARSRGQCEETVLVNYYGVSYGTVLGQTFTSLYPQHVGRFVLDSVVDIADYYSGNILRSTANYSDAGFSTFFTRCFDAGPEKCSFYTGRSSDAIRDRFNNVMAQFDLGKAQREKWDNLTLVGAGQELIKYALLQTPYNAILLFPRLADTLTAIDGYIKAGNFTEDSLVEIASTWKPPQSPEDPNRPEYVLEVWCSDAINAQLISTDKPIPENILDEARRISIVTGERFAQLFGICGYLHPIPKWRFSGKIGGDTATPVLFVGLSKDPVTPFENAEKAVALHKDSQMIYVDAVGHGVVGQRNWCAYDKIRPYFQSLTLPGRDNRCPYGEIPFLTDLKKPEKRSLDASYRHSIARIPFSFFRH
ncbi:Tripeptidyl aminopeptidase [Drechslerella dactyloides]|uniref:Tripeptidyl aminopeptidase n=1 Tax=Drechslerella dactyloides TaxID=74499 RepID=A0AAD6ISW6_DREDA|nr:Tripeptidyl aminopeptidase [Drechslerella dactyloides]